MTDRSRLTVLAAIALGAWAGAAHAQPHSANNHGPAPGQRPQQRPPQRPAQRPMQRPPETGRQMNRPLPPPYAAGRRLPPEYRGYNYRVEDWRRYRLPQPRPGYYWVQYGADFVMVNPGGLMIQLFVP